MELIKQLNENAKDFDKTSMDDETFERLVQAAVEDIKNAPAEYNEEEVVWNIIENIAGFEETQDAVALFNKLMPEVRKHL